MESRCEKIQVADWNAVWCTIANYNLLFHLSKHSDQPPTADDDCYFLGSAKGLELEQLLDANAEPVLLRKENMTFGAMLHRDVSTIKVNSDKIGDGEVHLSVEFLHYRIKRASAISEGRKLVITTQHITNATSYSYGYCCDEAEDALADRTISAGKHGRLGYNGDPWIKECPFCCADIKFE